MIRILIVDDQKIVREGIKILLEKKTEIEIVADASNGKEAVQKIESLQPDVVLLDINMPEIDGFKILEHTRSKFPQIKFIILSSHERQEYVRKATELGAKGYLLKNASSQELEWSIKLVNQGYSTIRSELLEKQHIYSQQSLSDPRLNSGSNTGVKSASSSVATLSPRDRANLNESKLLLAKKKVKKQYSAYQKDKKRRNSHFHTITLSQLKKTMSSFEVKLLVLAISFCLGFLIFIALS